MHKNLRGTSNNLYSINRKLYALKLLYIKAFAVFEQLFSEAQTVVTIDVLNVSVKMYKKSQCLYFANCFHYKPNLSQSVNSCVQLTPASIRLCLISAR